MCPPAARALPALLLALCALSPILTAYKPHHPRNVKLTSVEKGLKVTWDPPNELDGRPVDRYSIGYGKSMRSLRFIKVDKDRRSEVLEDVEPGVLHFLKISSENEDGMSKPVYRAETPGGGELVKLDGFAVEGGSSANISSPGRRSSEHSSSRPPVQRPTVLQQRAPQSSSGPEAPRTGGYLPIRSQNKHRVDLSQPQADQRNANKPKLASESVYVVSLQAQKAPQRKVPASKTVNTESPPPEHEVEEVEDVTVRILSTQSVVITWVDPLIKKQKSFPEGTRKYTVRYREKGESARWEYKETSQKRLVIEKLSADGMYEFSVQITQGEQHGKWSVSTFQRTPESAPAGAPENFEVKPLRGKGTAVTATWDPPDEPNGKLREYILSYAPALKPFGAKSVTYRGTTTSATIDGLTPGDRYIFKIRAVNRKGQGPQSKALSVAMPETSTTASRHSTQQKSPSRTSVYDDLEDDDTGESQTPAMTSPSTNKKFRPLSQTRSYHSIFSSVRGSVRNSGSNSRTTISSDKEEDEEETPTDAQTEDEATTNEAAEETRPESTHNAPSKSEKEEQHKVSPVVQDSSSVLKGLLPKTHLFPPKFKEGNQQSSSQSLTPRTSSVVSGSRLRRPSSSTLWSRTRNQNGASSSLPSSQDPVNSKKVHTSLYPEDKVSTTVTKSSTQSPQETKMETDRESTSSLSSAENGRVSTPAIHPSNSGSRPVYPINRRVPQTKGHRYLTGRQKTALTSSASSKSLTGSSTNDQNIHSTTLDTKHDSKNDHKIKIPKNENLPPSYQYTTTAATSIKEEHTQDVGNDNNKDKAVSSYLPSTASPGHGSSLSNKNSTTVIGSSQRKDGRIPWSRTASSVGAGRPILRGMPSNPTDSKEHVSGKSKTFPSTYTTKHLVDPILAKPTVKSQQAASSNGRTSSNDQKEDTQSGNDHEHDYISEVSKETHEIKNKNSNPTVSPKTIASDVKQIQRTGQTSDNSSRASYTTLNRLGLGSNGKVRSALLASRLNEFRLRGRLQTVQNTPVGSAAKQNSSSSPVSTSSSSYASQTMDKKSSPSNQDTSASQNANVRSTVGLTSRASLRQPATDQSSGGDTPTDFKTSLTAPARNPVVRSRYPSRIDKNSRGKIPTSLHKPSYEQGKNGRPNLTASNNKIASTSNENTKGNGVKYITGPDGSRWVVDLDKGVLMNEDGKVLQDSRGMPRKVVLGEDGKTIFDEEGSPLVNQEGMALFGHGRDSRPVVNPKDKYLTVGGKPLVGLDRPTPRTTTTTTTSTTTTTTTTTTTAEPTTTEMTTLEYTTEALPTCPPGTFSRLDKNGIPMMDDYGVLDCYPSDDFLMETTMFPTTTQLPTTTHTSTSEFHVFNNSPTSEFDAGGKKRFTAPYVNYIQKDPGAPCSLTEALEYLQVDVLAGLIEKDSNTANQKQPPKYKPHNITVIAMEGCHSFVILDWARPLKDDMVSGYMVHSASYDDILNNRWSSSLSSGTHLAVENLKPNSRYYFRLQAKNVYGLGPISETISYVTESDDPLLIERPPGGEPIWIPFTFRFNPAHSSCKGSQYVKRTWYRKFVGVVLCNSLRYKIFMGDGLKETFYSIADSFGNGEDHCQFVDSHLDGRTGPQSHSIYLPQAQGYYRSYRQEPVSFGSIGKRTPHQFVGWYECGVPIPGKW